MVHVLFVYLGVFEIDGVGDEPAQAASPVYYPSDRQPENQVDLLHVAVFLLIVRRQPVALGLIGLENVGVFMVLQMLGVVHPWQRLPAKAAWPFKVQRLVQRLENASQECFF